jgi:hypothetical protein
MRPAPRLSIIALTLPALKNRLRASLLLLAPLLTVAAFSLSATPAQAAFGVSIFASNCNTNANCTTAGPDQFTQANGHPPFGISDITFSSFTDTYGQQAPDGNVAQLRTDLPPGTVINHQAVPYCGGGGVAGAITFLTGNCLSTNSIGVDTVKLYGDPLFGCTVGTCGVADPGINFDFTFPGTLNPNTPVEYNLDPTTAKFVTDAICSCGVDPGPMASLDGIYEAGVGPIGLIYGHFGDTDAAGNPTAYHEYFVSNSGDGPAPNPTPPANGTTFGLLETRLVGFGNTGNVGNMKVENAPGTCNDTSAEITTESAVSYQGDFASNFYQPSTVLQGCASVPFNPSLTVTPDTTQAGAPDGVTTDITVPQDTDPNIATANVKNISVQLPAGLSMNPSAANGLEACTAAQFGVGTNNPVTCPADSVIGTATVNTPDLPVTLTGNIYLGETNSGPITGPPYKVFVDVQTPPAYGVDIRVVGQTTPSLDTGQLTATFNNLPDAPSTDLQLNFTTGAQAPLANSVTCGTATTNASLTPVTGTPDAQVFSSFTVDLNGLGAACASPPSFALTQTSSTSTQAAGVATAFSFSLNRTDNQEYLSHTSTTLPPGLVGYIAGVPLCPAANAAAGTCPASSRVGTATVAAGSGSNPVIEHGTVSLSGPLGSAPYSLSIATPSAAGPFDFGTIVTQQAININSTTAQVTVSGNVPTIVQGVPLRIQSINVNMNRDNFMHNPTNCAASSVSSVLGSSLGASQSLSSPFTTVGCAALPFAPVLTAKTVGVASRQNGIGLNVHIAYPAGNYSNIASSVVTLPVQLPSRDTTLQQACVLAVFNANPANCPVHATIGTATVNSPVLPDPMTGPAILVSHAGAAFPTMTILLSGDGVNITLVGQINIVKGITSTTFAAIPDVPVSSFDLTLPQGQFSILGTNGNLCAKPLVVPTVLIAQNGKTITQNTPLNVFGCTPNFSIVSKKVKGRELTLNLYTSQAGRIRVTGYGLQTRVYSVGSFGPTKVHVYPTKNGRKVMQQKGSLKTQVRISFTPKPTGGSSAKYTKIKMVKAVFKNK